MSSTARAAIRRTGRANCGKAMNTAALADACRQVSAVPQLAQNLVPGAAAVPHCVQWAALGTAMAVPQLEQNFAPGAFGA